MWGAREECQPIPPGVRLTGTGQEPAGGPIDAAVKLKFDQNRCNRSGWRIKVTDQLILGQGGGTEPGQNLAVQVGRFTQTAAVTAWLSGRIRWQLARVRRNWCNGF